MPDLALRVLLLIASLALIVVSAWYLSRSLFSAHDVMLGDVDADQPLYWNVSFPTHDHIAARAPIVVDEIQTLRSAIERFRVGRYTQSLDPDEVVGRHVVFEFIGNGVVVRPQGATGESTFSESWLSRPLPCGSDGTPPVMIEWRVIRVGAAYLTIVMSADGTPYRDMTLSLDGMKVGPDRPPDMHSKLIELNAADLASQQPTELVLHAIRHDPALELTLEQHVDASAPPMDPIAAPADYAAAAINGKVLGIRRSLELLSIAYPSRTVEATVLADDVMLREFAALGSQLFRALFGATGEGHARLDAMKDVLRNAPMGTRLGIDDGGAAVPWGIVYDGDPDEVDAERFWGVRFRMCRRVVTVDGSTVAGRERSENDADGSAVLHSFLNEHVVADAVRHQEAMEADLAEQINVTIRGRSTDALRQWMSIGATWSRCDLLYVFGHARVGGTVTVNGVPNGRWPDDDAIIDIDSAEDAAPGQGMTVTEMLACRRELDVFVPLPDRPIVFINACGTGKPDAQCVLNPLVKMFVSRWGMPSFVGTDWTTPQRFAAPFAQQVLEHLIADGMDVREALWTSTSHTVIADLNPFALNYCLYGRANSKLGASALPI